MTAPLGNHLSLQPTTNIHLLLCHRVLCSRVPFIEVFLYFWKGLPLGFWENFESTAMADIKRDNNIIVLVTIFEFKEKRKLT